MTETGLSVTETHPDHKNWADKRV